MTNEKNHPDQAGPNEQGPRVAPKPDPVEEVANAMVEAADASAAHESAHLVRQKRLRALVSGVGKAVYKTSYFASYGVMFPVWFLAGLVPTDNALGRGLVDGARAARSRVSELREGRELDVPPGATSAHA